MACWRQPVLYQTQRKIHSRTSIALALVTLFLIGCAGRQSRLSSDDILEMKATYLKTLAPDIEDVGPVITQMFDYVGSLSVSPGRTYHVLHYYRAWYTSVLPGASSRAADLLLFFDSPASFAGYYTLRSTVAQVHVRVNEVIVTFVPGPDRPAQAVSLPLDENGPADPPRSARNYVGGFHRSR